MPFKSRSQQRLCYARKSRGENGSWDCSEWSEDTNFKKLPEKASQDLPRLSLSEVLGRAVQAGGQGVSLGGLLGAAHGVGRAPDRERLRGAVGGGVRGGLRGGALGAGAIGGAGLGIMAGQAVSNTPLSILLGALIGGGGGALLGNRVGRNLGQATMGPARDRTYNVAGDEQLAKMGSIGGELLKSIPGIGAGLHGALNPVQGLSPAAGAGRATTGGLQASGSVVGSGLGSILGSLLGAGLSARFGRGRLPSFRATIAGNGLGILGGSNAGANIARGLLSKEVEQRDLQILRQLMNAQSIRKAIPPTDTQLLKEIAAAKIKQSNVTLAGGGRNAPSSYSLAPTGSMTTQNVSQAMSKFARLDAPLQLRILRDPWFSTTLKQAFIQRLPAARRVQLQGMLAS